MEDEAKVPCRIAVVGDRNSTTGFLSLGFSVFPCNTPEEAEIRLADLAKSGEFAVIFITEGYAQEMQDLIHKYKDAPLPAIVMIPQADGSGAGYGMDTLHRAVERAVGADILAKEKA